MLLRPGVDLAGPAGAATRASDECRPARLRSLFPPPGQQAASDARDAGRVAERRDRRAPQHHLGVRSRRGRPRLVRGDQLWTAPSVGAAPGGAPRRRAAAVQLLAWRGLYRGGVLHGGASAADAERGRRISGRRTQRAGTRSSLGSGTMAHPSTAVLGLIADRAPGARHAGSCRASSSSVQRSPACWPTRSRGRSACRCGCGSGSASPMRSTRCFWPPLPKVAGRPCSSVSWRRWPPSRSHALSDSEWLAHPSGQPPSSFCCSA